MRRGVLKRPIFEDHSGQLAEVSGIVGDDSPIMSEGDAGNQNVDVVYWSTRFAGFGIEPCGMLSCLSVERQYSVFPAEREKDLQLAIGIPVP